MRLTEKYDDNSGYGAKEDYAYEQHLYIDLGAYENCVHKLGQLEDIEEELGIDLITLFRALTDGIWIKGADDSSNKTIFVRPTLYIMGKKLVVGFVIPYTKRTDKEGNYFGTVRYFDGYGKTWALTKEELC